MKSQRAAIAARNTSSSVAFGPSVADVFHDRAVEQRDVLRHHARSPRAGSAASPAKCPGRRSVTLPALDVVEPLQQREHASIFRRRNDRPARPAVPAECARRSLEHLGAAGIVRTRRCRRRRRRRCGSAARPRDDPSARAAAAGSRSLRSGGRRAGSHRPAPPQGRASRCRIESPSVQTSTTSPVVAAPCCQSVMAQASSAIVSTTSRRREAAAASRDSAGCGRRASSSRSTVASKRSCS